MLQISSVDLHIAENPVMKFGFSRFQENSKRQDFGKIQVFVGCLKCLST